MTLRLPSSGGLYAWELQKDGKEVQVRVEGQATFNGAYQMLNAALSGVGSGVRAGGYRGSTCRPQPGN